MKQKCVILVPVANYIEPECEKSLHQLTGMGYEVRRAWGYSDISRGRSQMATDALADGFEELMWIDSDIDFQPSHVEKLRSRRLPIVGGIYPLKNKKRLACDTLRPNESIVFGEQGGLFPLHYLATGFLLTQRRVYQQIEDQLKLPCCIGTGKNGLVPYFMPMVVAHKTLPVSLYLNEDFSFCERAQQCGFEIIADTTLRLGHIGKKAFSWEEAGEETIRYESYRMDISST